MTAEERGELFGLLNVAKPAGVTSHDVVEFVRRILGGVKTGHCGTLDPAATGVLPLCVGKATRLAEYLGAGRKEYRAVVLLDRRTTTGDLEGDPAGEFQAPEGLALETIEAAAARFRGSILQRPHRVSAVRVGGRRLYERARRGESGPEPAARPVTIHRLELGAYAWPRLELRVECSAGTYIRQLAEDLGEALGVGGCLESLVRTRVDGLTLADARTPFELATLAATGELSAVLLPPARVLTGIAEARTTAEGLAAVRTGRPLLPVELEGFPESAGEGELVKVLSSTGDLVAIYRTTAGRRLQPCKVLI